MAVGTNYLDHAIEVGRNGIALVGNTPAEFKAFVDSETARVGLDTIGRPEHVALLFARLPCPT